MRLRYRLSLSFAIVIAICAGATFILVRSSTENLFRSFIFSGDAEKAKVYAGILGGFYAEQGSWIGVQSFLAELPRLVSTVVDRQLGGEGAEWPRSAYTLSTISALLSDRIVVADLDGIIVADSSGRLVGTVHPAGHLAHGIAIMVNFERRGTLLVGSMIDSSLTGISDQFLASVTRSSIWATAASILFALILGLVFTSRITRPLASLTSAVGRVASGDLSAAVEVEGSDEISALATGFNDMAGKLRRLEEAKKQIIADSAHELRTPVTLIRGQVEAMIDGVFPLDIDTLKSVHEETLRLSRLIDTLRELEVIDEGELKLDLEEIELADLARRAVSLFLPPAGEKGLALSFEGRSGLSLRLRADPLRLNEVLYNLLSNALKHTPSGGEVRLRLNAAGREVLVSVEDSGPGIPPEERERVFERFYRIDKSRAQDSGGRGLGLAIANEIAKAHGGRLWVEESELGGAAFVLALPAD